MGDERDWESTLKKIAAQMAESGVTELEVRRGDVRLRLHRRVADTTGGAVSRAFNVGRAQPDSDEGSKDFHPLVAPLTGVYYAAPNPAADPYVQVGDWVEVGTVVGLIETMKVFNEVTSDARGRIAAVQAEQGQLVQSGEIVALVDTAATPSQAIEVAP